MPALRFAEVPRNKQRTLRDALAFRTFRLVWIGVFASNIGTWMQNVALGAFAFRLTGKSSFGAILGLAQLGPQLVLATVGGVLADTRDRVRLMQVMQTGMMIVCAILAVEVHAAAPSKVLLFWTVVFLGVCNSLNGPVFNSLLPGLVPRENLPGVIALMSTQLNLSRVIGPAIGGLLQPKIDVWGVFLLNAISYLAVIIVLALVTIPPEARRVKTNTSESFGERLRGGFREVRRDSLVRRMVGSITFFSIFSLTFLTMMPVIAARHFHMDTKGLSYGLLYAGFGVGAAIGALAVGSVLGGRDALPYVPWALLAFAGALAVFGTTTHRTIGYLFAPLLGAAYFAGVTCMSTRLQMHLRNEVRGRVMAIWMMGFGGTIPIGGLAGAWIADHRSVSTTTLIGVFAAILLAVYWFLTNNPRRAAASTELSRTQ